jgi:hypothetical protein
VCPKAWYYCSAIRVEAGDVVMYAQKQFVVERILQPRTSSASDYACYSTGGLLLVAGDGDCYVLPEVDEDLEFLER